MTAAHTNPLREFFHLLSIQEFDCCKALVGIQKAGDTSLHGLAHQQNLKLRRDPKKRQANQAEASSPRGQPGIFLKEIFKEIMLNLAKPNKGILRMQKGGKGAYGAPKANMLKITSGNSERLANEIMKILQEFIFFEQSYSQFNFLSD